MNADDGRGSKKTSTGRKWHISIWFSFYINSVNDRAESKKYKLNLGGDFWSYYCQKFAAITLDFAQGKQISWEYLQITKGVRSTEREFLLLESENVHMLSLLQESLFICHISFKVFISSQAKEEMDEEEKGKA